MKALVLAAVLLAGVCSAPVRLTANLSAAATQIAVVGGPEQLVVQVTNTGPLIPHLGLVFRTTDRWFEVHHVTGLGGCAIDAGQSGFDCGDLAANESRTYTFSGTAGEAGTFHYELALRELVSPYDFVNDRPDGVESVTWDETVSAS